MKRNPSMLGRRADVKRVIFFFSTAVTFVAAVALQVCQLLLESVGTAPQPDDLMTSAHFEPDGIADEAAHSPCCLPTMARFESSASPAAGSNDALRLVSPEAPFIATEATRHRTELGVGYSAGSFETASVDLSIYLTTRRLRI